MTEKNLVPIVDTHQHLWDLTKLRLPWLKPGTELHRSFLTKDYLEATDGLNVVKAVYMEVAVAPDQKLAEAEYVIELCRRDDNPTVAAVIGGMPGAEGFKLSHIGQTLAGPPDSPATVSNHSLPAVGSKHT